MKIQDIAKIISHPSSNAIYHFEKNPPYWKGMEYMALVDVPGQSSTVYLFQSTFSRLDVDETRRNRDLFLDTFDSDKGIACYVSLNKKTNINIIIKCRKELKSGL